MPFSCQIDPVRGRGVLSFQGVADAAHILEAIEGLYSHPDWRSGYDTVWDARGLQALVLSPEDIGALTERTAAILHRMGPGRSVVVVRKDEHRVIARLVLYLRKGDERERRVFERLDEALAWLDGPPAGE